MSRNPLLETGALQKIALLIKQDVIAEKIPYAVVEIKKRLSEGFKLSDMYSRNMEFEYSDHSQYILVADPLLFNMFYYVICNSTQIEVKHMSKVTYKVVYHFIVEPYYMLYHQSKKNVYPLFI